MGIIANQNPELKSLQGLHLYHGDISNCSMRVRITLAEKQLEWVSHHLDLRKNETRSVQYFATHPYGLVPALVHDGVLIIESNDIIEYLDERFPLPPLRPQNQTGRDEVHSWLELASDIHIKAVKTYIYAHKMRGVFKHSAQDFTEYAKLQSNPELLEFHRKSSSAEGFSIEEIETATAILHDCFRKLEQALNQHDWLVGNQFTLADISWIPLHFTLMGANFPFTTYPNVQDWADKIRQRPSFQKGVLSWCEKF